MTIEPLYAAAPSDEAARRGRGDSSISRLAVIGAALFQIFTPVLPAFGIGRQIGEQSASVQTLITPAGWTFSIWLVLYAGSLVFAFYQAMPAQRGNPVLARVRWLSAGAFVGNGLWALYTQLYDVTFVSVLIIGFTLICLLGIYRRLADEQELARGEQFLVALPLSALAAWLTAATIVNIAAALNYHGVGLAIDAAAVGGGVILVGGTIASVAVWRGKGNPWYALTFLWALAGIYGRNGQISAIAATCAISALAVIAVAAIALQRTKAHSIWFG